MSKVVKANYTAEAVAGFTHRTAMEEAEDACCAMMHHAAKAVLQEQILLSLSDLSDSEMIEAQPKQSVKTTF